MPNRLNLAEIRRDCANTLLGLYKNAGAGHIASSLSCLEILVDLCFVRMNQSDKLVLSKGHAAAALYTTLAKSGRIQESELETFYKEGTRLAAHPPCNRELEAIPFGTGSLGHGLSLASGIALSQRFTKQNFKIYCVLSDGDCNEGSTWEAALFAAHRNLNQLTVIVDANGLQGFGETRDIMNLEPFAEKWRAFGFNVVEALDGNSFQNLENAFDSFDSSSLKPRCIIARTKKGHSISFMEDRMEWHYLPMDTAQYASALQHTEELYQKSRRPSK